MKKSKVLLAVLIAVAVLSISSFVGCNVNQWVHSYTENILVSLNNEDYISFSKDFGESLKAEIAQENFPEVLSATTGVFGKYIEGSKKMFSYNFSNGTTTVEYNCKFEKNDKVQFRVVFEKINDVQKVVGIAIE